jgi:hypothetical protein
MLGSKSRWKARKDGVDSTRVSGYDMTRPQEAIQSRGCSAISDGEKSKISSCQVKTQFLGSSIYSMVSRIEGRNFVCRGKGEGRWLALDVIFINSNLLYYLSLGWTAYLLYISVRGFSLWIWLAPVRVIIVLIFVVFFLFFKGCFCFCLSLSSCSCVSYRLLKHLRLVI